MPSGCRSKRQGKHAEYKDREKVLQQVLLEDQLRGPKIPLGGTNCGFNVQPDTSFEQFTKESAGDTNLDMGGKCYCLSDTIAMQPGPRDPQATGGSYTDLGTLFGTNGALFKNREPDQMSAHFADVTQGSSGNFWLMTAIQSVARYGVAERLFENEDLPLPLDEEEPKADVDVKVFKLDGKWGSSESSFIQSVSTQLLASNGKPIYVTSNNGGEYWPSIAEKAVVSAMGSYQSANGKGLPNIGLAQLIGGYPGFVKDVTADATVLTNAWKTLLHHGIMVFCAFKQAGGGAALPMMGANGGAVSWGGTNTFNSGNFNTGGDNVSSGNGLMSGHAYTVLAIVEDSGERLVYLRNPWGAQIAQCGQDTSGPEGAGVWTGKWSDCDTASWDANPSLKQACGHTGVSNDGNFWMSMDDLVTYMEGDYSYFIPKDPELLGIDITYVPSIQVMSSAAAHTLEDELVIDEMKDYLPESQHPTPNGSWPNSTIRKGDKPVVVILSQPWCGACQVLKKSLKNGLEGSEKWDIVVATGNNTKQWMESGHTYVPQVYFFGRKGQPFPTVVGTNSRYKHFFHDGPALAVGMRKAFDLDKAAGGGSVVPPPPPPRAQTTTRPARRETEAPEDPEDFETDPPGGGGKVVVNTNAPGEGGPIRIEVEIPQP